jgi:hypothetical protein
MPNHPNYPITSFDSLQGYEILKEIEQILADVRYARASAGRVPRPQTGTVETVSCQGSPFSEWHC